MTDVFTPPENTVEITTNVETVTTGNAYETLVGDGKKFRDNEALARSALEKDRFIAQLQREAQGRQAELERALKDKQTDTRLEEIATMLQAQPNTQTSPDTTPREPAVTEDQIAELVRKTIQAEQTRSTAQRNADAVVQQLRENFGSDYATKLKQRTQELGLTEADMNNLAARSPQAFMELVKPGVAVQPRNTEPPRQNVNTQFAPVSGDKTYSDFEKLRTSTDPAVRARYWSPAVQMEIHTLGEKALKAGDPDRFFR